jgi:LuxR family maltose regulon positive regulatory protein
MQLGFQKKPSIPVRIGIHSGDIIFNEEEIIGDSVNVASRIESLAVPGSVLISDKVYDEIKNQESVKTYRLKTFKLKNVERPIEVYAISNAGLIVPEPEEIAGKTTVDKASATEKQIHQESQIQQKDSPDIILATKLYIPLPRSKIVHRSRLTKRIDKGLHGNLTLISAPAGFGKTTLVSEWITGCERPAAWLSLDEGDNDPIRFLTYLIAAIKKIASNIGEGALGLLQSPQPPPTESILTTFLNEISTIKDNFILILDDYHVINTKRVHDTLSFLLDHMPPQMHLAITTREDPDLPLPRLRVRSQLTELRASDLRFTHSEAAEFLNQVMDLTLSTEDIAELENRTEGWIAGLQLAALSMQGRDDISGFIKAFAGHDRYIVDYLVEEVLQSQPKRVRSFLLQTSNLRRLSGPLCDAVTGQKDGKGMLESLERGNLFVIPLDDKRQWYRYHHLFADVLHAHLMKEYPDREHTLHRRASEWYEHNGSPADAIHHALAAEDFERAAGLAELAWPAMDLSFQSATWLGWVKALPEKLIGTRPVLSVCYAWALLNLGELEDGEARLRDAERLLDNMADMSEQESRPSLDIVIVDEVQYRSLPAVIAGARAYIALSLGDIPGAVKYARQSLDLLPEEDHVQHASGEAFLGLAYLTNGDLDEAHQTFTDFSENMRLAGNITFAISPAFVLADIKVVQGCLHDAISIYERSLEVAREQGEPAARGTGDLYLGLSGLHWELADEEAARKNLMISEELGEQASLPDWPCRFHIAKARIKESQRDLKEALDLLEKAERLYYRNPVPEVRPIAALKTRVRVKQGRLTEVLSWVRERGLSVDDDLSYLREYEHITLARVLIAEYKIDRANRSIHEAMGLLERLLKTAEEGGRMGSVIEILVLQALAHEAQGNIPLALEPLERALALAEPEGYVRTFLDEGMPMAQLLSAAAADGIMPDYIGKLLAVFKAEEQKQ